MALFGASCVLVLSTAAFAAEKKPFWDQEVSPFLQVDVQGAPKSASLNVMREQLKTRFSEVVSQMVGNEFVLKAKAKNKSGVSAELRAEIERNLRAGISHKKLPKEFKAKLSEDALDGYEDIFKENEYQSYLLALGLLDKLSSRTLNTSETRIAVQQFNEISESLKSQGRVLIADFVVGAVVNGLHTWTVKRENPAANEAKNLVDPKTGKILSAEKLAALKSQGADLGAYDPAPNSSFWRERSIKDVDVEGSYGSEENPLYAGAEYAFPENNTANFKSVRKSQSKPKLNLTFLDAKGKKRDIKLKFSTETHSEPTASRLAAALGFYSDLSRHVSNFRINLGKKTYDEFKQEVYSYYRDIDVDEYKTKVGKDKDGNYVILAQALIEPKVKGPVRVGPWSFGANGHKDVRETRALQLFNIWIANGDIKERENNKLIVKADEKTGLHQMFHMQHDMGFAFGDSLREVPGEYAWHVVKSSSAAQVSFDYRCFQRNSGFDHITWADARWFTRKLSQLTRAQIQAAVDAGGWPKAMNQLLVEKLISRRNDFVKAFGLSQEIAMMEYNEKISSADGTVVNGKVKSGIYAGFPQDFNQKILGYIKPFAESFREGIVGMIASMLSKVDHIDFADDFMEFDALGVAGVNFNLTRDIEPNPEAPTDAERYVVKDKFSIGMRLSPSVVVGGLLSYVRTFTLIYSKETEKEATYGNHFVYNIMLPYHVAAKKLPRNHVLIVEDSVEGGGMLKAEGGPISIGTQGTATRVMLNRSIVSARDPEFIRVYQDKSVFNEFANKVYARLAGLKINFTKSSSARGELNREVLRISRKDLPVAASAVDGAIHQADFAALAATHGVEREQISSQFRETVSKWSLLGFIGANSSYREDQITRTQNGKSSDSFQIKADRKTYWSFLENGEKFESKVWLSTKMDKKTGKMETPAIRLSYRIQDNDTSTDELSKGYLAFVDQVANQQNFLNFTPNLHSINRKWGKLLTIMNVTYSPAAVNKLFRLDVDKLEDAIKRDPSNSTLLAWGKRSRFIDRMREVRGIEDDSTKYSRLVKALRNMVWKDGPPEATTFKGHILGLLNRALGDQVTSVSALITVDSDKENKLPGAVPYYREKGHAQSGMESLQILEDSNPIELYYGL